MVKNVCNAGDTEDAGLIPGSRRSPGEGMATHSSILALKIPWMEELGAGYYPWGCKELDRTERLHFKCEEGVATIQLDVPRSQLPPDTLMAKGPL